MMGVVRGLQWCATAVGDIVAWLATGLLMVLLVPLLWPIGWVAAPLLAYWWLAAAVNWLRRGGLQVEES